MRNVLVRLFSLLAATYVTIALWPLFAQGSLQLMTTIDQLATTLNTLEVMDNGKIEQSE